jgi:serine O-acetyltransferase
MSTLRSLIAQDLRAMSEGETLTSPRILLRMAVHARWRAVPMWRLAQASMRRRWTKPVGLWLTDRILATSGAELQPTGQIGPGVVLKHTTGLVVGGGVTAGAGLTLHQNVTLGDRHPYGGQPKIGDGVTVGAGACVLGPITVGDRAVIAANAVVLSDVPADSVVAGAPARVVRHLNRAPSEGSK